MFYVVPLNEYGGIKELRISSSPWTFWIHGPKSGVGIEEREFETREEAEEAIRVLAPHLLP